MKTLKLLSISLAFLSISFAAQAQRGVRIGYIDMEYILESVPEYQEAATQLDGKVQRWKADIEKMNKEIDQMKLNLANERVLLTKELIEEREEEIKILEDEMIKYQQDRFGPNGDLVIQRRQLVQPIQDQVFNIVQEIAEAKKYDFIFDKSADVVMLFAAKRNDISENVLRSINRSNKRKEVTTRKEKRELEKRESLNEEEEKAVTQREEAIENKKSEREAAMLERKRVRDSIRQVKREAFQRKRDSLLQVRKRRQDSIKNARNGGTSAPPTGTENNGEGEGEGEGNGGK
ncbi:OmpH family outer membrane protein [Marinirhabdus gelatinilytica]|uniref:Periplasmic chaperone for outer membrane proteins Skp n=1 Tax=Marinirhabdus gelatinilytica TaxID=1703343 RepID=A0A370Q3T7_9FLAO|nr:OmpH family outer membrane protein [Marinirhabdus gelatinilytica]RDK83007.1 periplasmic chaperone for outer membrane proteins Skp [Marinirhabdus gelatinilytica]